MASEKFLTKFFSKLTKDDFTNNVFLDDFYKFYKKSKSTNIFQYYIDYLLRNQEFQDENDKSNATTDICNEIKNCMLLKEKNSAEHKTTVKVNKTKALKVLNDFIEKSSIITYENPNEISNEQDEQFRGAIYANITSDIINIDGRKLPIPQPDLEFGKRSDMMNVWRDTETKCKKLCEDTSLDMLVSKLFFIDTKQMELKPSKITTVESKEINELLPVEKFISNYSGQKYNTNIKLTNTIPLEEALVQANKKIKTLYICTNSQMVQGGNADQGVDVQESMLYLTSTYSVGISKALYAYPLLISQILLCPNVLVFKNTKYQELPMDKYQRLTVMCCTNQWRPKLVNSKYIDLSIEDPKKYLYEPETVFYTNDTYVSLSKSFANALETALFFGYDSLILDDRAIEDNNIPAHLMAKMLKNVLHAYNGRFKDIIIAVNKTGSFNIFKHYFSV